MDNIQEINLYFEKLKRTIDSISRNDLSQFINVMEDAYQNDKQVFIMGNGGSGATASHYVCDFNKGVAFNKSRRFKLICLNDNMASILAYANDLSYEDIFVEQLKHYFNENDVVVGISGSGNSTNVIKAIEYANNNGGVTVGLTGYSGGKLKKNSQYNLHVDIDDMQIAEDLHMIFCHMFTQILAKKLI